MRIRDMIGMISIISQHPDGLQRFGKELKPVVSTRKLPALKHPEVKKPSLALSYFLGTYFGDGYAYKAWTTHGRRKSAIYGAGLNVSSEAFASSFTKALIDLNLHPIRSKSASVKGTTIYRARANSIELYKWLLGLTPETVAERYLPSNEHKKQFIRGFYESEGYAETGGKHRHFSIRLFNTCAPLLQLVRKTITELGYKASAIREMKSLERREKGWSQYYYFGIYGISEVQSFFKEINPVTKRWEHAY